MKKILITIVALISIQTHASASAFANNKISGESILCTEENSLFHIQLQINELLEDPGPFAPKIYAAEFTTLFGPRLTGATYDIQVSQKGISTRLKSGYVYTAQIPDGSNLSVEKSFEVGSTEFGKSNFTAILSNYHGQTLRFDCVNEQ